MAGRRRITEAQLKALAKGRRTAAANRRKKKAPARRRRRNPTAEGAFHDIGKLSTIRLSAPNTPNGNPRRIYVTFKGGSGGIVGIYDDDYLGDSAIPEKARRSYAGHTFKVSAGEYNRMKKMAKDGRYINPAHGNFMNAIAAKERGDLGREAYQNPVRPLMPKNNPVPQLQIASVDPRKRSIVYWGAFGWGPRNKALGYPTQSEAKKVAQKMKRPVVIVLPSHTTTDIFGAFSQ